MKKFTLLFSLLFIAFQVDAQLWISADVGFNIRTSKDKTTVLGISDEIERPRSLSLILGPTIGYNINEKITIGGIISYNLYRTVHKDDEYKRIVNNFEIALLPFLRYNHVINDKFGIYGQLDFGPSFGKAKSKLETNDSSFNDESNLLRFSINLRPGVYYQFSSRFSMNAHYGALGFRSSRVKSDGSNTEQVSKRSDFGLNLQMSSLRFGLNYHF